MGVGGLLTVCLEHRAECIDTVDLLQVAQDRDGIEILIDYYSLQHFMTRHLWTSLAHRNPMLRVLGGEYAVFRDAFRKLYEDLKQLKIELVIFRDGAKGSCKIMTQQKLDTWKYRHRNDMKKLQQLTEAVQGHSDIRDLPEEVAVRPVLLEIQVVGALRAAGCEIVECATGEADFVIAKSLLTRPKAYAVFSNDSDFAIFKGCAFIPHTLFDTENDLHLGEEELLPQTPRRLMVGVIHSDRVAPMLQLDTHEELVELSIIAGNDFTSPFLRGQLRGKYDMPGRRLEDAVTWVRKYRRVENHPAIHSYMRSNPEFGLRVTRSRQFYCVEEEEEEAADKHHLTTYIEDQVRHGHYPSSVVSMHLQFYWYRMLLEDYTSVSCEAALGDLRSHVYSMLLPHTHNYVLEYGNGYNNNINTQKVFSSRMPHLPLVTTVDTNKIFPNLRTFGRIMTHYEPQLQPKYMERYGRKTGFLLYLLRYFLNVNVGYNLHVGLEEVLPLAALVLGHHHPTWYLSLTIPPTLRSVTIGNMFQDIYRHGYQFLAALLHLQPEFPQPWEVFSGAVWNAFYFTSRHRDDLVRMGVPAEVLQRIDKAKNDVIHQNRHILEKLFDGFFPFHQRF